MTHGRLPLYSLLLFRVVDQRPLSSPTLIDFVQLRQADSGTRMPTRHHPNSVHPGFNCGPDLGRRPGPGWWRTWIWGLWMSHCGSKSTLTFVLVRRPITIESAPVGVGRHREGKDERGGKGCREGGGREGGREQNLFVFYLQSHINLIPKQFKLYPQSRSLYSCPDRPPPSELSRNLY